MLALWNELDRRKVRLVALTEFPQGGGLRVEWGSDAIYVSGAREKPQVPRLAALARNDIVLVEGCGLPPLAREAAPRMGHL